MKQTLTAVFERLRTWQAAHKKLFRDDALFRKRHTFFLIALICLSCPLLAVYGFYFGVGLPDFETNVAVIFCVTAVLICVVLRHLHFINQRIGSYLQSNHDA